MIMPAQGIFGGREIKRTIKHLVTAESVEMAHCAQFILSPWERSEADVKCSRLVPLYARRRLLRAHKTNKQASAACGVRDVHTRVGNLIALGCVAEKQPGSCTSALSPQLTCSFEELASTSLSFSFPSPTAAPSKSSLLQPLITITVSKGFTMKQ